MSQEKHLAWTYDNITKIPCIFPEFCYNSLSADENVVLDRWKNTFHENSCVNFIFGFLFFLLKLVHSLSRPRNEGYLFQYFAKSTRKISIALYDYQRT
jgi:hypothetical protein